MARLFALITIGTAGLFGACLSLRAPEDTAHAYARALRDGRVEDAWGYVASQEGGLSRDAFLQRYSDPSARAARADAVEQAAPQLAASSGALTLVHTDAGWRVLETVSDAGAKKTLDAFLDAADRGDFQEAYALMGAQWRSRYTPERLKKDFDAEPLAKERLSRARAASRQKPVLQGDGALFPIGDGKAVRLKLEGGEFRVVALE